MRLKIKKLHPGAIIPTYATDGAACFDLYASEGSDGPARDYLERSKPSVVNTGLAFEIPAGWAMLIYSRSGHGFRDGVTLANGTGIIDSDYRGEVRVKLTKDTHGTMPIAAGDRIAQAMLVRADRHTFRVVEELDETVRGAGGFGSTGA